MSKSKRTRKKTPSVSLKEIEKCLEDYFNFFSYTETLKGEYYLGTIICNQLGYKKFNWPENFDGLDQYITHLMTKLVEHQNRKIEVYEYCDDFRDYHILVEADNAGVNFGYA